MFENYLKNNPHPYKERKSDALNKNEKGESKKHQNVEKKIVDELYKGNDNAEMYKNN